MQPQSQAILEYVDWEHEVQDYFDERVFLSGLPEGLERIIGTDLTIKIHARKFPKEVGVEEYHSMLLQFSHKSIVRPKNLYRYDDFDVITFDPLETTIGTYYTKNADILTTGQKSNHVTDFSSLMIQMISDIASGLECIHKKKMYHGTLNPEDVYLILDHDYSRLDEDYATVKLALRSREDASFDNGKKRDPKATLGTEQKKDWKKLGHLIASLLNSIPDAEGFKEIYHLSRALTEGRIASKRQLSEHPATWSAMQRSLFLIGAIQLLKPWNYHSDTYPPDVSYSVKFHDVIQLMPNDAVDETKPESHCRFDKLTRNVVTHLDDPTKPDLKLLVGVSRGDALRYFRHFHPLLFTDLISNARHYDPKSTEELLKDVIKA